jgi:hypothetical protein
MAPQCEIQVERGTANKGDEVEVVGLGNSFRTTLTGIGEHSLAQEFPPVMNSILKKCSKRSLTE